MYVSRVSWNGMLRNSFESEKGSPSRSMSLLRLPYRGDAWDRTISLIRPSMEPERIMHIFDEDNAVSQYFCRVLRILLSLFMRYENSSMAR
jgi:hypothetical protein